MTDSSVQTVRKNCPNVFLNRMSFSSTILEFSSDWLDVDRTQFWKNFNLGKEVDIAGAFIFNGLRRFHEIESLHNEGDVFEVLYNLSVGLERLLKVAVVLVEHDNAADQEAFEKSLITHTHQDLIRRIQVKHDLNFGTTHNDLIDLLGTFYKTHRYGRFTLGMTGQESEKKILQRFLEKHLKIKIEDTFPFQNSPTDMRMKKFLGKQVGKVATSVYSVIDQEATRLSLYTYELRSGSKAEKIFLRESFNFEDEDILWKELLVYLMSNDETTGMMGHIRSIEALDFDPGLLTDYLRCFSSEELKLQVLDELESLYEEIDNVKSRLGEIGLIGEPHVYFDDEVDDEE